MTKWILNGLPLLLLLGPSIAWAGGLPAFESDLEADRWIRKHSDSYRNMAEAIDRHGGYTIAPTTEAPGGLAYFEEGRGHIGLNEVLKGAHRVSVLIFEMTNLHQENRHQEVAWRVRRGELNNPAEFALLREIIEYDGLRLHRNILLELEPVLDTVPPEMITWVSSTAKRFADYQLPFAYDYIKAQAASGHTAYYVKLFEKHRAEYMATVRNKIRERTQEPVPKQAQQPGGQKGALDANAPVHGDRPLEQRDPNGHGNQGVLRVLPDSRRGAGLPCPVPPEYSVRLGLWELTLLAHDRPWP